MNKRILLLLTLFFTTQLFCTGKAETINKEQINLQFPKYQKEWEESAFFSTKVLSDPEAVNNLLMSQDYLSHDIYVPEQETWLTQTLLTLCCMPYILYRKYWYTKTYQFKPNNYCQAKATPFKKDWFKTSDGYKLECLVRDVGQKAQFTVFINCGFLPGLMNGLATLVKMLPANCNIILFNARGKGNSEGSVALWNYGTDEWKDVQAGIKHSHEINTKIPVVCYGICGGAFHLAKALCKMGKEQVKNYNICGLFFDSLVTSIQKTVKQLPNHLYPAYWMGLIQRGFLWGLRSTVFRKSFMAPKEETTLDVKEFAKLGIPTFHGIAKHDNLTICKLVEGFANKHKTEVNGNEELCKIHLFDKTEFNKEKNVSHANAPLQCKKAYTEILATSITAWVNRWHENKQQN